MRERRRGPRERDHVLAALAVPELGAGERGKRLPFPDAAQNGADRGREQRFASRRGAVEGDGAEDRRIRGEAAADVDVAPAGDVTCDAVEREREAVVLGGAARAGVSDPDDPGKE